MLCFFCLFYFDVFFVSCSPVKGNEVGWEGPGPWGLEFVSVYDGNYDFVPVGYNPESENMSCIIVG